MELPILRHRPSPASIALGGPVVLALAVALTVLSGRCSAQTVRQSAREIPVVRTVDIVVVGGTVGAVAATVQASDEGARVLLVAPRTYLGEDLCATLSLWLDERDKPLGELTEELFADGRTTTPLRVKKVLEAAMLKADADFLFGCYPTDVLLDGEGYPAGIVIANRSGRQAIVAKTIIDATERAVVAEMAGAGRREADFGTLTCKRVVLGGQGGKAEPHRRIPAGIVAGDRDLDYFEYQLHLDIADGSFAALAEAEQAARDQTYRDGQLRAAERLTVAWPDPICGQVQADRWQGVETAAIGHFRPSGMRRLYVLSGSADVPRASLAQLQRPASCEAIGRMVGSAAAGEAQSIPTPRDVAVRGTTSRPVTTGDVREVLRGLRPTDRDKPTIRLPELDVPVLADVDIVVVGGGTSGACAAIAAARQGSDVLVLEYQEGLGGVGTLGLIGRPYHGRNAGFTNEVPFPDKEHDTEYKMEWFRREIRRAGGKIWFGVLGCGVLVDNGCVKGAIVATPSGRGAVLADVVVDATGSADMAVAAGADSMYGGDSTEIALQGTGLPMRPLGATYVNTDYLLVDESDAVDVWRALVGVRMASKTSVYDVGTFIQNRERRRVVGDHVLSYLDQIAGRTYPDSIVLSGSDYDSHGYPSDSYFALIPHTEKTRKANHPAPGGTCFTPYRCLLPRGVEGMLVIGLGISMRRDAAAMVRMQKDMHNQGYAAGVAAAMAVRDACTPRQIDVRSLQRHLVEVGNLPESVLRDEDSFPLPHERIRAAVAAIGDPQKTREAVCKSLAIVLAHREQAHPMLKEALSTSDGEARLTYAKILGFLGDQEPVDLLLEALEKVQNWDEKIYQGKMAEYAHLPTPIDALIQALGHTKNRRAIPAILRKLDSLDAHVTLSHHRAVALALEQIADPAAAQSLARLLNKPDMHGHAMTSLEPLYDRMTDRRRRVGPLREIVLARALYRCGDYQGMGKEILEQYRQDIRGLFARHATGVLERPAQAQ